VNAIVHAVTQTMQEHEMAVNAAAAPDMQVLAAHSLMHAMLKVTMNTIGALHA
jgi:hypothetical protein